MPWITFGLFDGFSIVWLSIERENRDLCEFMITIACANHFVCLHLHKHRSLLDDWSAVISPSVSHSIHFKAHYYNVSVSVGVCIWISHFSSHFPSEKANVNKKHELGLDGWLCGGSVWFQYTFTCRILCKMIDGPREVRQITNIHVVIQGRMANGNAVRAAPRDATCCKTLSASVNTNDSFIWTLPLLS